MYNPADQRTNGGFHYRSSPQLPLNFRIPDLGKMLQIV